MYPVVDGLLGTVVGLCVFSRLARMSFRGYQGVFVTLVFFVPGGHTASIIHTIIHT